MSNEGESYFNDNITIRPIYVSKVSVNTHPIKLATSIQLSLKEDKTVEIIAMGKESIYIMAKAISISQGFSEQNGLDIHW